MAKKPKQTPNTLDQVSRRLAPLLQLDLFEDKRAARFGSNGG
jgi:hypothetical protein